MGRAILYITITPSPAFSKTKEGTLRRSIIDLIAPANLQLQLIMVYSSAICPVFLKLVYLYMLYLL